MFSRPLHQPREGPRSGKQLEEAPGMKELGKEGPARSKCGRMESSLPTHSLEWSLGH